MAVASPTTRFRIFVQTLIALGLVVAGVALDVALAWQFLVAVEPGSSFLAAGLAAHVAATLVWAIGLIRLQRLARRRTDASSATATWLSGWTIAALCFGLALFPGIGTLACTLGFTASYLLAPSRIFGRAPRRSLLESVRMQTIAARSENPPDREVRPLVDMLREQNTELRRVVVKTLGEQGDRDSVQLLRGLLIDPNPDVRSDAAVALTRLEDEYSAAIAKASARLSQAPHDPDRRLALGRLYSRYQKNGMLDSLNARQYAEQAYALLEGVARERPDRVEILVDLARVASDLGRSDDALGMLERALELQPMHVESYQLALEVAFRAGKWDIFGALAQRPMPASPELRELLRWWVEASPHSLGAKVASGSDAGATSARGEPPLEQPRPWMRRQTLR